MTAYWRDEYDWKKSEARMNKFPHYRVSIPDEEGYNYTMHFIAIMSDKKDATPLMLLHGWSVGTCVILFPFTQVFTRLEVF